jgi:hypothetical protein
MRVLKLAMISQRWDLAAHTIVLATAKRLRTGDDINDRKKEKGEKQTKRQPRCK